MFATRKRQSAIDRFRHRVKDFDEQTSITDAEAEEILELGHEALAAAEAIARRRRWRRGVPVPRSFTRSIETKG